MRSSQLQAALSEFIEAASAHLHAAVQAGAEVQFELEPKIARRGMPGASLYCYRALTAEFIAARISELEHLPSYAEAARLLANYDGLDRYLASVSAESPRGERSRRARAAIQALLWEVFDEQSNFELRPERLQVALQGLQSAALAGAGAITLVATLHGLTISSPELRITRGLTIAHADVLQGLPEGAIPDGDGASGQEPGKHLVVALDAGEGEPLEAIASGRAVLKDLLRALRLFGDGRVALGSLGWVRIGGGRWGALALGTGGRSYGMLVVTAEHEDELRGFCNLVSRRAPDGNELAWALRRFELGCERPRACEALTDHLLALRVLLEPEGPASGLLAGRLAVLCATPENRMRLTEQVLSAVALEREVIAGATMLNAGQQELVKSIADHLRALLRDVICGHLDADLVGLADQLLLASAPPPAAPQAGSEDHARTDEHARADEHAQAQQSVEQMLGDAAQSQEILDIFI
jgi:hypothetical protein